MKTITFIAATLTAATSLTQADTSWVNKIQPLNAGAYTKMPATKFLYKLSWNGTIGAGNITFDFNKKDKRYPGYHISQAYGRSTGAAYALFPYNFSMTSFTPQGNYKTALFVADEADKKAKTNTKNEFKANGVTHNSTKNYKKKQQPRVRKHLYKLPNSHDPLSAVQYIRSQTLSNGQRLHLSLHPFNTPIYAQVTVLGREVHMGKRCIKLDVKLDKVDYATMNLRGYKKLQSATLWISDDANRHMLEMRCKVKVGIISGDVRMTLQKTDRI